MIKERGNWRIKVTLKGISANLNLRLRPLFTIATRDSIIKKSVQGILNTQTK